MTSALANWDYEFFLFGRFHGRSRTTTVGFDHSKVQELLAYMLVFRNKPHHRETIAETLWANAERGQSRKYLRQTLWQLLVLLNEKAGPNGLLSADQEWIQINSEAGLWLDLSQLEEAYRKKSVPHDRLDNQLLDQLRRVVSLYSADLLEGCYQDWCIQERERARTFYLSILETLLGYCETRSLYEEGLRYGETILNHDRAHERTHLRLMRLHYLSGDRTRALRQFGRCESALMDELGVKPAQNTTDLWELIRNDSLPLVKENLAESIQP